MQRIGGGLPPHRLFRLLLTRPRPRWPLSLRLTAAPSTPLHVVALRGVEEEEAVEAVDGLEGEARLGRIELSLVALSLYTPEGRAFASAEEAGALADDEADQLINAVLTCLSIVSPTYGRSDVRAWQEVLRKGAEHASNIAETMLLGSAADPTAGRPDRYFGLPLADLTDGHLMAYRAARAVFTDLVKRHG